MSPRLSADIHEMRRLFAELDAETGALQKATGLACTPGCSRCCFNPKVETTVAEMLPMAETIWRQGLSLELHHRLSQAIAAGDHLCVMLRRDGASEQRGSCAQYPDRPGICRLFGFAGAKNKVGDVQLSVCAELKVREPQRIQRIQEAAKAGQLALPLFSTLPHRIERLASENWRRLWPINFALIQAIENVNLDASYQRDQSEASAPGSAVIGFSAAEYAE